MLTEARSPRRFCGSLMTYKNRELPFLLAVALLLPSMAYAYIDPGFGALVWQALFAAIVGSLFFLRSTIAATGRWIRRKVTGAPAPVPAAASEAPASERPTEPG